ncbi:MULTISPECIES: hypothetical protein [unclassified Mesorhizobium]|uniref:hypothetical protein n=1 Tax=unclassified Mesorhizobium TaxID=325217 RepID=UPI000ACAAD06|nr:MULTISPECIES: hypothetical protein [unclassified Mesorhizobium]MBN9255238.1 hypothetical protein [Mesorhizobium sp.]MBN9270643.1 hypothetical protein [Mesorhizobium sp.]
MSPVRNVGVADYEFPLAPAPQEPDRANACPLAAPCGQAETAPAPPFPAGAVIVSNPVAKTSEDNGRASAATGIPMAGEVSRDGDAADLQRSAPSGFSGDDDGRRVEAAGGAASVIPLSQASMFILTLVAAHEGRAPQDILAELIAAAADAIGIHSLIMRDAGEIDLGDLPPFAMRAANRFRGGGP